MSRATGLGVRKLEPRSRYARTRLFTHWTLLLALLAFICTRTIGIYDFVGVDGPTEDRTLVGSTVSRRPTIFAEAFFLFAKPRRQASSAGVGSPQLAKHDDRRLKKMAADSDEDGPDSMSDDSNGNAEDDSGMDSESNPSTEDDSSAQPSTPQSKNKRVKDAATAQKVEKVQQSIDEAAAKASKIIEELKSLEKDVNKAVKLKEELTGGSAAGGGDTEEGGSSENAEDADQTASDGGSDMDTESAPKTAEPDTTEGTDSAESEPAADNADSGSTDGDGGAPESPESGENDSTGSNEEEAESSGEEPASSNDDQAPEPSSGDDDASSSSSDGETEPAAETGESGGEQGEDAGTSKEEDTSSTGESEPESQGGEEDSSASSNEGESEPAADSGESEEQSGEDSSGSQEDAAPSSSDEPSDSSGGDDEPSTSDDQPAEQQSESSDESGSASSGDDSTSSTEEQQPADSEAEATPTEDENQSTPTEESETGAPEGESEAESSSDEGKEGSEESQEDDSGSPGGDDAGTSDSTSDDSSSTPNESAESSDSESASSDTEEKSEESEKEEGSEEQAAGDGESSTSDADNGGSEQSEESSSDSQASGDTDSDSAQEETGETSDEQEKEEGSEEQGTGDSADSGTESSDESGSESEDQSEEASSDSQDSETSDSEEKGSDDEQSGSQEDGEGQAADSESESSDSGDQAESGGDETEAGGDEKEAADSEETSTDGEEKGEEDAEEGQSESGENEDSDQSEDSSAENNDDNAESTPEEGEGESEDKEASEDGESSDESSGDEEKEDSEGGEEGGDDDDDDSEGDDKPSRKAAKPPKPPKVVDPLKGAKLAVGGILGLSDQVVAAIFKSGANLGAQIAYCPSALDSLQKLNADDKAAVSSACASSLNDDDVNAVAQAAVVVLNNKTALAQLSQLGMPANITSIIECAFSPVKDVNLPDGVKIVIGFGPDPDAEPFVLPEDPDEDEDEDDQDEDGEESGEDGGDDDDGEKAEEEPDDDSKSDDDSEVDSDVAGDDDGEAEERLKRSRLALYKRAKAPAKKKATRKKSKGSKGSKKTKGTKSGKASRGKKKASKASAEKAEASKASGDDDDDDAEETEAGDGKQKGSKASTEDSYAADKTAYFQNLRYLQCPVGYRVFGTQDGTFCCKGDVSPDGLKCVKGDQCGMPGTPRPPDAKWEFCSGTTTLSCPTGMTPYADWLGGLCCAGNTTWGRGCTGTVCRLGSNADPRVASEKVCEADNSKSFGPTDPTKMPNFVCPSGSQPYGSKDAGGFCCSGKVSPDNLKCDGGNVCAFPGNDKPQGNGACKGGNRFTCGAGAMPFADFAGGFCCTGAVVDGVCKGTTCAFPSNPRPNGSLVCQSGSLSRDMTTVGDDKAVTVATQAPPIVPNLPSAASVGAFDVGDISVQCSSLPGDFQRRISLRLPGLKMSWKNAQPVAQLLLGVANFVVPDVFGLLPDIATISHMAFDYDPLPVVSTARLILSVNDIKLGDDFGLVNITGSVSYDQGSGVSFDLSGSGVLPVYKNGISFTLPLITDGDMLPLTLATQDRNVSLSSLLAGVKVDSLFNSLPPIPLLSGGINAILSIQIKDIVFGFCKPGAAGCATRISLNMILPQALTSFDAKMLPLNIDNAMATVSIVNPFSGTRSVELRLTGTWSIQGSPLTLTVVRSPETNDAIDMTDYSGDSRRIMQRDFTFEDDSAQDADYYNHGSFEEPEFVEFSLPSYDHWVDFPEPNLAKQDFSFFEMPLAHVNHHMMMHRRRLRKRDPGNSTTSWLTLVKRDAAPNTGAAQVQAPVPATAPGGKPKKERKPKAPKAKVAKARSKSPKKRVGSKPPPFSGGKWLISASTPSLPLGKLIAALAADLFPAGPVASIIDSSGLRDFAIENFTLMVVLGGGDLAVRLSGAASVLPQANVQIVIGRQAGGPFGGTLALAVRGDMFTSLLQKLIPGFNIPGLNLVASGSTLGLIVSSRDLVLTNTPLALDPPLDYMTGIKRGFELNLRMGLPPDCGGQAFCEVMKKLLGANAALQISTIVNPPDVMLSAAVADIRITEGLLLKAVGFSASFPKTDLLLFGSLAITVDRAQPPLVFEAHIGVKGASVILGASMTGIWQKAFGWDRLSLGNIIIELGITATLGAPSILIGGEIAIGKKCYTPSNQFDLNSPCIGGAVYVSIDPANPQNNWFGGELNNLDIKHIISAFTDLTPDPNVIPAPILNSGLPGKTVVSFCPMGGCTVPGRTFPMGFYLKGTLNIFDVTARAEIQITPGQGFKIDCELSPFSLAGGLIQAFYSKDVRDKGPRLLLDIQYMNMAAATIKLNAYVKVLVFETLADISISPLDYRIAFTAQYYVFTASFAFKASIGASLSFAVSANFDMNSFYQFIDRVVEKISGWAQEGAKKLNDAKGAVDNARRDLDAKRAKACDWVASCQKAKDAVKCGRVKKRHLLIRSASWEDEFWKKSSVALAPREQRELGLSMVRLDRRWSAFTSWVSKNIIEPVKEKVIDPIVKVVVDVADKIKQGVCKGWEVVSGAIIDTGCKAGCLAAQAGIDLASGVMAAASGVLSGLSYAVKAAATVASWVADKLKSMINIRSVGFSASVDAGFQSGLVGGAISIHFDATIFGANLNVDFSFNFKDILGSAARFFEQFVKDAASKIASIFRLAQRDLSERDVEFLPDGHFRFKKRDLLDNHETVLFDTRVHTHDEALDLIKAQIRKQRLAKRALLEKRKDVAPGDPNDPAAHVGQKIGMDQLPVMPALAPGYDAGPAPGLEGGEDNDFRIKFGDDLYMSCPALVGAFSRKSAPCSLKRKVHATIFLSVSEPKGMSFRTASGLCLAVDSKSSVVLTQCMTDLPNGVWKYNNETGQFSAFGAGVAIARNFDSKIELDDIVIASAPSDGKCMTATKKKKVRMSKCLDPTSDSKAALASQSFAPKINAESINLGDLVTFHSTGQVVNMYIQADPKKANVGLGKGNITVQQDDTLAAFKVVEPICGSNYYFTLESVAQNGSYLAVDPSDPDNLVLTDKPKKKEDACWLPTPGISQPLTSSGCPGITFSLQSRSRKGYYIRVDNDGKKLFLGNKRDIEMLTCWRPVPPTGAPSAKNPTGESPDDLEDAEADKKVDERVIQEGAEDIMDDAGPGLFGDGK